MNYANPFIVVSFCVAGSGLTLVNKILVSKHFPYPSTLTFFQCIVTAALIQLGKKFAPGVISEVEPIAYDKAKRWAVLVILFIFMLLSSMFALERVTITTLTVVRNLTTLTTAFCDWMFLESAFNEIESMLLLLMLAGACLYGAHDISFDFIGYVLLLINCASTTAYQIRVKILVRELKMSALSMSYYNNILSLPFIFIFIVLSGEINFDIFEHFSHKSVLLLICSCVLGFVLSTTAFRLNQIISATAIMIINNANKFFLIIISEIFVSNSLDGYSTFGCVTVILSSLLYSQVRGVETFKACNSCIPRVKEWLKERAQLLMYFFTVILSMIFLMSTLLGKDQFGLNSFSPSMEDVNDAEILRGSPLQGFQRLSIPFPDSKKLRAELSRKIVSTHHCLGDNALVRSCIFWNVLYDMKSGRLKYLRFKKYGTGIEDLIDDPKVPILVTSPVLNRKSFGSDGLFIDEMQVKNSAKSFKSSYEMEGINLLFTEHQAQNFGHFLIDNVFSAFVMLTNLGITDIENVRLLSRTHKSKSDTDEKWMSLFSVQPLNWSRTLEELSEQGVEFVFFHSLVAGGPYGLSAGLHHVHSRNLGDSPAVSFNVARSHKFIAGKNFNLANQIQNLRKFTMKHMGLDPNFIPEAHQIIVIKKTGRRKIQNTDELYQYLVEKYPTVTIKVLNPAKISLKSQMEIMSRTTLLITPRGGISFLGMYQSPGAFSICLEDASPAWRVAEKEYFWQNLSYLKQIMYPFDKKETRCGSNQKIGDCDIHIELDKMSQLIDQAFFEMSMSHKGISIKDVNKFRYKTFLK